eukprot:CAMPEP_0176141264 /NCGR_PEP_ID=MMETSP0120_2-20121206/71829_1 /TAXON_ID=160619 /ORGANISM="Kryptoperidinium foliaceum, Strain CCMP 1326" /LENGTH=133 /DNA_ID=CAMNT_0017477391 /DNA_START=14 /DNA_END=411 /DNA_ORIENTATION=-
MPSAPRVTRRSPRGKTCASKILEDLAPGPSVPHGASAVDAQREEPSAPGEWFDGPGAVAAQRGIGKLRAHVEDLRLPPARGPRHDQRLGHQTEHEAHDVCGQDAERGRLGGGRPRREQPGRVQPGRVRDDEGA